MTIKCSLQTLGFGTSLPGSFQSGTKVTNLSSGSQIFTVMFQKNALVLFVNAVSVSNMSASTL